MSDKRAIIIGSNGQDGQLLTQLLLSRQYHVLGVNRNAISDSHAQHSAPAQPPLNLGDQQAVTAFVKHWQPDEIYYLAACHVSSEQHDAADPHQQHRDSLVVNQLGILHFLQAVRLTCPAAAFFYTSSCLVFGSQPRVIPQDENTTPAPDETYGWAKCTAGQICADYRNTHNINASVGILYNHESPLRQPFFFSQKVVRGVHAALKDSAARITIGNLDAVNDWGWAADFVEGFTRVTKLPEPGDYIFATGQGHTVREFLQTAFSLRHLDWQHHVTIAQAHLRRNKSGLVGNPAKLTHATGWRPTLSFEMMIEALLANTIHVDFPGTLE